MPPICTIEEQEQEVFGKMEITENENIFINIVICIIWVAYIYEVAMFINRMRNN